MDKDKIEKAIYDLLMAIGDDPNRSGIKETPKRVAKLYEEILRGNAQNPAELLKFFDEDFCEEMVVVKDIDFHSMCEHHLLPFYGVVHIAYIPAPRKLLGLSKLARIVEMYARRLQLQEKMGSQIADLLEKEAGAIGVAVAIEAEHMCISMRGIKKIGAKTITTALRGQLKTDKVLRREALQMIGCQ
ncbi:MAG: GTP cyclohydrolase I FolE [Defluviitaleaceae bacterium]|nr:GTP cyclohydrolase I FolE [Defluviitaleaceae bacterium]